MKKVAIITINGNMNYGNRLQNYALQEAIHSLGFSAETIRNGTMIPKITKQERIKDIWNMPLSRKWQKIKKRSWTFLHNRTIKRLEKERQEAIKAFTEQYITETAFALTPDSIPDSLSEQYDFFVCGSDQVWNPFYPFVSGISFLTFAPQQKRIAYAPSFGVSTIAQRYEAEYRTWLSGIRRLSVREEDGARIIQSLTGRSAPVVLDPTMLLSKEKWLRVAKKAAHKPEGNYVVLYHLKDLLPAQMHTIKKFAERNGLEIVEFLNPKLPQYYAIDPAEFLDYISSAALVVTDSFHGSVFSILFERPFVVLQREVVNASGVIQNRLDNLLLTFHLLHRNWESIREDQLLTIDYAPVEEILEQERAKSWAFLRESLDING